MTALTVVEKKHDEFDIAFNDLEKTQKLCQSLMKTPHYAKMGEVGIFAIVQKAKSLGMSPLEALNGGLYLVNGKVEMSGQSMLALIRKAGHSVSIDPKSTSTHVVLHGKRCDNGDMWSVSFGIEDAKRAGIYKATWEKYGQIMCIWRCVSMLGRFLFSDIIKGCYVEGEIKESPLTVDSSIEVSVDSLKNELSQSNERKVSKEEAIKLRFLIDRLPENHKINALNFIEGQAKGVIENLPYKTYETVFKRTSELIDKLDDEEVSIQEEAVNE